MIIVLERKISTVDARKIKQFLDEKGFTIREIVGEQETVLGAVGTNQIDIREVEILPGVDRVIPISKPYKLASRELKKNDTLVSVRQVVFGGRRVAVIAGPCAIESRDQILEIAKTVRESGAVMLRGGAFKPRSSPYSFQGLGEEGLKYLKEAGERYNMPVASEIVTPSHADMMKEYVDVFQVGARNMQNFELLKTLGKIGKPVLLKRGLSATIEEWLMAAEYIMANGTDDVILCERGIRTFETYTRNTLDLSAIPVVKKLSHLPVLVDPSHATGIREKVLPMSLAGIAAGADGLIVEVHTNPEKALSDGPQTLFPEQFEKLMRDIKALSPVIGKEIERIPEVVSKKGVERPTDISVESTKIGFQGERGAYSEKAVHAYFGEYSLDVKPFKNFRDVFDAVLEGKVAYGVLPVENALAGSIHENYDLLLDYPDIKIIGEKKIRIEHNLIGLPTAKLSDIKKVFSHPQGLAQSRSFLDGLAGVEQIPFYDTAGSVAYIAEQNDPTLAAVASEEAAVVYGMKILKAGVETNPRNYTRFVIIARRETPYKGNPNKGSIVFSVPDKPGALFDCLKILSDRGINMTKLESRPIHGKPWEYMFYTDFRLPENMADFDAAIADLEKFSHELRLLGLYEQ